MIYGVRWGNRLQYLTKDEKQARVVCKKRHAKLQELQDGTFSKKAIKRSQQQYELQYGKVVVQTKKNKPSASKRKRKSSKKMNWGNHITEAGIKAVAAIYNRPGSGYVHSYEAIARKMRGYRYTQKKYKRLSGKCVTHQGTPEELAEVERMVAKAEAWKKEA